MLSNFLSETVDVVWGTPLILLLIGGGIYLAILSRFLPLVGFKRAILLISNKFHHKGDEADAGQITHFQALTNAISGTVGIGNIGGVAIAITQGGAGAIFWMWVAALIGMNTKFFECTLSVMYRGKDYTGEVQGGPMYVIKNALPKSFMPLAYMFAICGLIGPLPLYNSNELAAYVNAEFGVSRLIVGIVAALIVVAVYSKGIKQLGRVTAKLVPFMCGMYIIFALIIIFMNLDKVPGVFLAIFDEAFNGRAATGGVMGMTFMHIMKVGVKRAAFSNEAGVGTAPMAHSNVKTVEPVSEGLVAMLGPFVDTIVVCTLTALVILTSIDLSTVGSEVGGLLLTKQAIESNLPVYGNYFLALAVFLFAISSIIGFANYVQKCWNFLFNGRKGFGNRTFIAVYALCVMQGAIMVRGDVINLLDIFFALMVWPNMIATLILAPKVKLALKEYWAKY